jgi:CubicO group peptidase (beta-lactamase class C family)
VAKLGHQNGPNQVDKQNKEHAHMISTTVTTEKSVQDYRMCSRLLQTTLRIVEVTVALAAFLCLRAISTAGGPLPSPVEFSTLNGWNGFAFNGIGYGKENPGAGGSPSAVGDINGEGVDDPFQSTANQFQWRTSTPASQGMSGPKLNALKSSLALRRTKTFLVIRNDTIVFEWYAAGYNQTTKHFAASMAKALVTGVSLGVALSDGRLTVEDLALNFVPAWIGLPDKSQITIRHLGTHTSGIDDAEEGDLPHKDLTGWKGDFWKNLPPPNDPFTISRDKALVLFPPGTRDLYSNPGNAMLSYAITSSLTAAPQKDLRTLLRDRIMRPIGAADAEWAVGYGKTFLVDGLRLVPSWGGASYTPRAAARVARLLLSRGDWQGNELINPDAVDLVTQNQGGDSSGLGWWTNIDGKYGQNLPPDAYLALGSGHQVILVVPSLNLITVRNGGDLAPSTVFREPIIKYLIDPLMGTFLNIAPSVNAGPNQSIRIIQSASLSAAVTDDGFPLPAKITSLWTRVSGPGTAYFDNPSNLNTQVSFSQKGTYTLRVTVSDGEKSVSDDEVISVSP